MASVTLLAGTIDFQHSKVVRHVLTHPPAGLRVCAIIADFTSLGLDASELAGALVVVVVVVFCLRAMQGARRPSEWMSLVSVWQWHLSWMCTMLSCTDCRAKFNRFNQRFWFIHLKRALIHSLQRIASGTSHD